VVRNKNGCQGSPRLQSQRPNEYSNKCVENTRPSFTQMKREEALGRSIPFAVAYITGTCHNAKPAKPKLAFRPCDDQ
jgi:hypothetical protein